VSYYIPLPDRPEWEGQVVSEYQRKLNSIEWKGRSFRIKERDHFACQDCESRKELEVHHLKYTTPDPWDEPGENLVTLCHRCHFARERERLNGPVPDKIAEIISGTFTDVKPVPPTQAEKLKLQAQLAWAAEVMERRP
jgi:HNH endonuclease